MYIICIHLVNPTMSSMELWRELNVMIQEQNLEEHHIMKWGSAEDFAISRLFITVITPLRVIL